VLKINYLIISYIICATVIILSSKCKQKTRHLYYGINCIMLLWEIMPLMTPIHSEYLQIIYDWSPLLFLPIFHRETELLTQAFQRGPFDPLFIRLENNYFPSIMAIHDSNRANYKLLSEFLHVCYLSFYVIIYGVPLYFYLKQDMVMFSESIFAMLLVLFLCYITHSLIPVCGPRNLFEKINDHRSEGFFFKLVHRILEDGSTHGTAFPSGHTGIACVILLITGYFQTPLFYYIFPFGIGLIVSTIYGRFHYMLDMIAGLLYAFIAFFITIWIYHQ
jgi:membrane-associated phospholipid phosphatase